MWREEEKVAMKAGAVMLDYLYNNSSSSNKGNNSNNRKTCFLA